MSKKFLMLFNSTHEVIRAERICRAKNLAVQVVPVPRHVSSQCGMGLEYAARDKKSVRMELADSGITAKQILELPS